MDVVFEETFESWFRRTSEMSRMGDRAREIEDELREALSRYDAGDGRLRIPGRTWVAAATA